MLVEIRSWRSCWRLLEAAGGVGETSFFFKRGKTRREMDREMINEMEFETRNGREMGNETRKGRK
jgi:hypothetical protein